MEDSSRTGESSFQDAIFFSVAFLLGMGVRGRCSAGGTSSQEGEFLAGQLQLGESSVSWALGIFQEKAGRPLAEAPCLSFWEIF